MTLDDLQRELDRRSVRYTRDGAAFRVDGSLYLRSLTALPEGVTLSAGGYLDLRSLTALPEGVSLSAGGYLYLSSLTALPEGVTLSAGGYLYLPSLTTETQRYQGRTIRLRTIDGICTRLIRSKRVGEATLWTAQYFKGRLDAEQRCFVAEAGGLTAHGDTAERALRDLRFKAARRDFDAADLVATIKRRGTVSFNDYRLLTGACESGLRHGLEARGLSPDTEELPLADALRLCRGAFGGDAFARLMEAA